ncbi:bacterial luciferase-like protein [Acephala macrosclerotiorum]|nr:bacterial luciferase-like protein [Acephala macrosclerotiorum]
MAEKTTRKKWIMNAFAMFTPGHLSSGQWRHPKGRAGDYSDLEYWTDLAKTLEAGKFHGLSSLTTWAYTMCTKARYERAEEYLEVVYKLLEGSWKEDSRIKDAASGRYSASERVRAIQHNGKYFKIKATHQLHPSIQRTPFLLQAGASSAGKNFASKHSEAMFLPGLEPHKVRKEVEDVRARLAAHSRTKNSLKFLASVLIIVDETDEKAQAKYQSYLQYADLEGAAALFSGWIDHDLSKCGKDEDFKFTGSGAIQSMVNTWSATIPSTNGVKWTRRRVLQELAIGGAHPRAIGPPETVADNLQNWVDVAGIDGFNLSYAISPGGFEDMIKYLWPE